MSCRQASRQPPLKMLLPGPAINSPGGGPAPPQPQHSWLGISTDLSAPAGPALAPNSISKPRSRSVQQASLILTPASEAHCDPPGEAGTAVVQWSGDMDAIARPASVRPALWQLAPHRQHPASRWLVPATIHLDRCGPVGQACCCSTFHAGAPAGAGSTTAAGSAAGSASAAPADPPPSSRKLVENLMLPDITCSLGVSVRHASSLHRAGGRVSQAPISPSLLSGPAQPAAAARSAASGALPIVPSTPSPHVAHAHLRKRMVAGKTPPPVCLQGSCLAPPPLLPSPGRATTLTCCSSSPTSTQSSGTTSRVRSRCWR